MLSRIVIHIRPRYGHDHGIASSSSSSGSSSNASVTGAAGDDRKLSVDARAIIRRFSSLLQGYSLTLHYLILIDPPSRLTIKPSSNCHGPVM